MRFICKWLALLCMSLACISLTNLSFAESEDTFPFKEHFVPCQTPTLLKLLHQAGYNEGWQFFEPAILDVTPPCLSAFERYAYTKSFVLVGYKNKRFTLFTFKNKDGLWHLDVVNPNALNREGWVLSYISSKRTADFIAQLGYEINFDFVETKNQNLMWQTSAPNRLDFSVGLTGNLEFGSLTLPAEHMEIRFIDDDLRITLKSNLGYYFSVDDVVSGDYSDETHRFNLSKVPINFQDIWLDASFSPNKTNIPLYFRPNTAEEPVFYAQSTDSVKALLQNNEAPWAIVYYRNAVLYTHAEHIIFEHVVPITSPLYLVNP